MNEHPQRNTVLLFDPMEITLTATCTLSIEHNRPPEDPPDDTVFERLWWWLLNVASRFVVDALLQFSTTDRPRARVAPRPSPTPRYCRSGRASVA